MRRGFSNVLDTLLCYVVVTATLLVLPGCFSSPYLTGIVHKSDDGAVYLEEVLDLAFEASHPASIEPETLGKVLGGVYISEVADSLAQSGTTGTVARYAFSEADVRFLAPLLSHALNVAGRGDQVVFRLIYQTRAGPLATEGTLYVHGSSLYLTLTHYHYKPRRPGVLDQRWRLPYSSALTRRRVLFTPLDLGHPTKEQPPGAPDQPTLTTLAIDYHGVEERTPRGSTRRVKDQASGAPPSPVNGDTGSSERRHAIRNEDVVKARQLVSSKEEELRVLNERLRALQDTLAQKEELIKKLKRTTRSLQRKQSTPNTKKTH